MFTGLVEEVGQCAGLEATKTGRRLTIAARTVLKDAALGDSISVNGCCVTIAQRDSETMSFDLLEETLRRTNLGGLQTGDPVNLERALRADARLGGHFVQGHIDDTITLRERRDDTADLGLRFGLPSSFARYVVPKGSIAINGVSLTVAELGEDSFTVWIIPHTRAHTNLAALFPGSVANVEFDLLAKYTERLLGR